MMGISRISFLLVLGGALGASEAALETPRMPVEASATVTVTAEATPVDAVRTPHPVKVLDAEAIRQSGAQSLDQLLPDLLPGQIQAYGGPGSLSSLYLGASRAGDVVVLLDGIRITDPSSLSPSFSDFSLGGIDRVEILQGPASTRYGADTHGGVVSLSSAGAAKAGFSGSASIAGGSHDLGRAAFDPAYGWDGGWLRAGLATSREAQSIAANDSFRSVSSNLSLGQKIGEDGLLTATYRNHYRGTPLPFASGYDSNYTSVRIFDPTRENALRDEDAIGSYRQTFGKTWLLETSFGHVSQHRAEPGSNVGDASDRFQGQRNQGVASLTWTPIQGFQANLLLDHSAELVGQAPGSSASYTEPVTAHASHNAAALELAYESELGLRAVVSGRYQQDAIDITASGANLPRRDSNRFVYKAGLNWLSASGLRVYVSNGTSYNAPSLYDLTYNASRYPNAPGLENETSQTAQAGASFERGPWSAKLEASRTRYDRVLYWMDLGGWSGRYANGRNLRIQGIEGSLAYAGARWRLEGFARSQEARNESQPEAAQLTTGGATGRPFFTGGLRASATMGDWRVQGRWSYVGSSYQYFDDFSGVAGAKTHFNDVALAVAWTPDIAPGKPLTLTLRGEHLAQKEWTREEWLQGRMLRKNDAYLIPIFPSSGPTVSLEATYRF
ncbi:MAG TPA: TonB-dependent receptor [Holophaga sp.]|nr:TonB-dependent receptor [Holophaga sp.]